MLKAFTELGKRNDGDELAGGHANQLRHHHHDAVYKHVVQQVVAVIAPHRHLPLGVVQRMQVPPPFQPVLATVRPVAHKIKHHQVNQQAGDGIVGDAGPQLVEVKGAVARCAQGAKGLVKPGIKREKKCNPKKPQPVDQGVQHVGANGGTVCHGLYRPPALQGRNHSQQNNDLNHANHDPRCALVGVFGQVCQAQGKQGGLHEGLKQPLLHA